MAEQIQRSRGRSQNYKLDRGGVAAEFGPFYGIVKNTNDSLRSGRIQVYIPTFGDGDENDPEKWTTVSYAPPYFGSTPYNPSREGFGSYIDGNSNSYGMWFTPPDVGITVLCVFVNGDRSQGYYIGVVPDQSIGHMVPAIGAAPINEFVTENQNQSIYFASATQLPVVEINTNNLTLEQSPKFFNQPKPVQSVVAQSMFRQGIITDNERGPITSSSQRESPSAVFGVSTPGIPIYAGGIKPDNILGKVNSIRPQDAKVVGRTGGHSLVMDDGDITGNDRLVRLRTMGGHQIMMSDSGEFLYIIHANGLSWVELGKEGTMDVYAANSINLRTQGDFNVHADRDINMFAGRYFQVKSQDTMNLQSMADINVIAETGATVYSKVALQLRADGSLALDSQGGSWNGGDGLVFTAGGIDLNGPAAPTVEAPEEISITTMDTTEFDVGTGWQVLPDELESIVSRAPTHEPWPYHNTGVDAEVILGGGSAPPPGAVAVQPGVEIERTE